MNTEKFVTAEYHDGQAAYHRGQALTSNPHLENPNAGPLWYWVWGWQDAMADDVRSIKETIMFAAQPRNGERIT